MIYFVQMWSKSNSQKFVINGINACLKKRYTFCRHLKNGHIYGFVVSKLSAFIRAQKIITQIRTSFYLDYLKTHSLTYAIYTVYFSCVFVKRQKKNGKKNMNKQICRQIYAAIVIYDFVQYHFSRFMKCNISVFF